jgi:hypothetical protein
MPSSIRKEIKLRRVADRGHRLAAAAVAGVVVAAIGGGTASAGHAGRWSRSDLKPVTQPAPVGGRFVLYVARNGGLEVVALDASSGRTTWSDRASPSSITPGEVPGLAVVGREVVYVRALRGSIAQLVARDAATGKQLWRSAAGQFSGWPDVCPDDATTICVTGAVVGRRPALPLRFSAANGGRVPSAATTGPGREVGRGLFDVGVRSPELLVATHGNHVSWARRLSDLFTLPGASTDFGWNFDRLEPLGLYVGSAGAAPVTLTKTHFVADLTRTQTAGFRIESGAVVWRAHGNYVCNALVPCPGASQSGYSSPDQSAPTIGIRTLERGTLRGSTTTIAGTVSRAARVALQGFEPRTGRTLWTFAAGRDVGLIEGTRPPPQVTAYRVVLRAGGRRLVALDLRNGSTKPLAASARAWCRGLTTYKEKIPFNTSIGTSLTVYVGQYSLYPCTAAGKRVPTPKTAPRFVGGIGALAAGTVAWSDPRGVVAVPVR